LGVVAINCLHDGVNGAENINKKQDGWKAEHETFSSSNVLCMVVFAVGENVFF
jgi:hypothetical protein